MRPNPHVALISLIAVCWTAASAAAETAVPHPGPTGEPAGKLHEQLWWVPMEQPKGRGTVHLETTVYRPDGSGPFPLAILNHGSPADADARRRRPRERYLEQSDWLVAKGFVVVVPMRRGYANSEGDWAEGYKTCNDPDYVDAGFTTANDIGAVLKYFQSQTFIDPKRAIVVGQSAGGFGTLAVASRNLSGVLGVINFDGGRGAIGQIGSANRVCKEERLIEAAARYGTTARTPAIWLYAQNDLYFRPDLARAMFEAYARKGAPAEFVAMGPLGRDGHDTFPNWSAHEHWTAQVEAFLTKVMAH